MSGGLDDIREAMRGAAICTVEVRRNGGEWQWCGRVAVGLRRRPSNTCPVCAYHARGDMVPLDEIAAALRQFGGPVVTHET